MRLLSLQEDGQPSLTNDLLDHIPPYAVLSHTWGNDDDEVSFEDLRLKPLRKNNVYGHRKIQFCAKQAAADNLKYFWVDTCCINKENHAEFQEAITSMYKWYRKAARCYVYLPDVRFDHQDPAAWETSFRKSRWFTRGWTLQELLAPSSVEFFDVDGKRLGDKTTLVELLHEITGISRNALRGRPLSSFSVDERFLWARGRDTKREEDKAYSLLGIFGVYMPMLYGEGNESAMKRLRREIPSTIGTHIARDYIGALYIDTKAGDQKALGTIPLGRNRAFVGREHILRDLLQLIPPDAEAQDCQRVTIEGLGGIGKTQIALEAAFRLQEIDPSCSIFWVPAVSRATFENGYRDIGRALELPGVADDKDDVKALVVAALERSSTNWLLIIDNLDDPNLLSATDGSAAIRDYLPFSTRGSILFTTRNHEVTVELDVKLDQTYTIDELSESEAMEMLRKALSSEQMQDPDSTKVLLDHLAHLPLAIKQAAAYMARTGITTKKYLESYLRSDTSRITFLSRDFEDRGRYRDSANPIAQTWLVSFNYIKTHYPLAARYLNLICFLAEKDIPRELFPEDDVEAVDTDEAIGVLRGYCFITQRDDGSSYDIHRLVRLATRNSMDKAEAGEYLRIMAEKVESVFPFADPKNINTCLRYMPHVEEILAFGWTDLDPGLKAELLELVGLSYRALGNDDNMAMHIQHEALVAWQKVLNLASGYTLNALLNDEPHEGIRRDPKQLRINDIAMQMHEEVLQLRRKVLGPAHHDTLTIMHSLATMHAALGKYKQAEHMHRHVLSQREYSLGFKHPDTLSSLDDLGNVLHDLGRYKEAERHHVRALYLRKERLGDRHIDTLHSMNNWALDLGALGRHEEAERVHREELEISREICGPTDPETLNSMNNLALTMRNLGQCREAEELFQECLVLRRQELGPKHIHTLNTLNNLALVLGDLEKFDEAEQLHREELELCRQILPSHHPDILISLSNLALILEKAGKCDEAQGIHQQIESFKKENQGSTAPDHRHGTDADDMFAMYVDRPATEDKPTEDNPTEDNPTEDNPTEDNT